MQGTDFKAGRRLMARKGDAGRASRYVELAGKSAHVVSSRDIRISVSNTHAQSLLRLLYILPLLMLSFNLLAKVVSFLTVVPTIQAGFNPSATNNVAVYYGQNSYGRGSSDPLSQKRLSAYCANTDFNIIPLAFLLSLSSPAVNFANAGDNCTAVVGSTLVSCPQLEADIQECQSVYGKTILLSIGGATYTEGGFTSSDKAVAAANNIWAIFGPRQSSSTVVRPFGASVIDGFDFDFESTVSNVVPFANRLRSLMTASSAVTGKNYYFTAAPQCPYPDQAGKDLLQGGVFFDAVFVQFYNNYCGLQSYVAGATIQNNFNFETWDTWAKTVSLNPNVKVFLGVPAYTTAAGSGYTPTDRLATIIAYCKTFSSFGGVMMWDMSQAYANAGFLDSVRMALGSSSTPTTSKVATTKGVTTKAGSSTKAGTTNAGTSKAATTKRPGCSSVRATTATTTRRTSVTPSSTPRPSSPVGSSVSTSSRRPASTSAPSTPNNNYVTQWNQCGGSGYTGPTVCEPPLVCKVVSEWWSQCDTAPNNPNPSSAAVTTRRQSQTNAGTTSARNPTATTARTSFLTSIRASSSSSSKKTTSTTRSSSTTRAATTARTSSTPATTRPQSQSPTRVQTSQTPVPTSTLPASSDFVNEWGQCGGTGYTGTTICRAPFTCRILSPWWSQCELPANAPVSTLAPTPTPTRAPAATPTPTKPVAGTGTVERWSQCGGEGWTGGTVCIAPYTCQYFGVWYSQCG